MVQTSQFDAPELYEHHIVGAKAQFTEFCVRKVTQLAPVHKICVTDNSISTAIETFEGHGSSYIAVVETCEWQICFKIPCIEAFLLRVHLCF